MVQLVKAIESEFELRLSINELINVDNLLDLVDEIKLIGVPKNKPSVNEH